MWTLYSVRFNFLTRICGSVPSDPELVRAWLDARKPSVRPPGSKSIDEINEEVLATIERGFDEEGSNILVFQRHEGVCCLRAATFKAHIKDCARVLSGLVGKIESTAAFSTRVKNGVYHDEHAYWVPILRPDGKPVTKHDGEKDQPIHTWRGSALKRFEWIEPARVDFTLKVLDHLVKEDDLHKLFQYGGVHGYGGERSNGEGRYEYALQRSAVQRAKGKRPATTVSRDAVPEAGADLRRRATRRT